jgi:hypothetical protein
MLPPAPERPKLLAVMSQLGAAVEELLLSGLTTASEATRQTLAAALQEAARFRLLRLGSTLRTALEELGRFTAHDESFSRRRLVFFLSRAWLLSRGLTHSLQSADEQEYDRLAWVPPVQPLARVEAVCLGVVKKVAAGAFVAFEFRFRVLNGAAPLQAGQSLTWSFVFPIKPGLEIPPEGFLHLPQKQQFLPMVLLEQKIVIVERANVVIDNAGARLSLTEQSTVMVGEPFHDWQRFLTWSPEPALARLRGHTSGPLDLESELQEEIVLHDYAIGPPTNGQTSGLVDFPITAGRLSLTAIASTQPDGQTLREQLEHLQTLKKERPPLFGLLHYERCRLVFQPLTAFRPRPESLTLSSANINKAALLKALSFT